jgi:hypothetical protein
MLMLICPDCNTVSVPESLTCLNCNVTFKLKKEKSNWADRFFILFIFCVFMGGLGWAFATSIMISGPLG